MNLFVFLMALFSISLTSMAQIFLKKTMLTVGMMPTDITEYFSFGMMIISNCWFMLGIFCYMISIGLWMFVLGKIEVSMAYPLSSIGFLITATIGYFFMNENVNLIRIIGLLFICVGIVIISKSGV